MFLFSVLLLGRFIYAVLPPIGPAGVRFMLQLHCPWLLPPAWVFPYDVRCLFWFSPLCTFSCGFVFHWFVRWAPCFPAHLRVLLDFLNLPGFIPDVLPLSLAACPCPCPADLPIYFFARTPRYWFVGFPGLSVRRVLRFYFSLPALDGRSSYFVAFWMFLARTAGVTRQLSAVALRDPSD